MSDDACPLFPALEPPATERVPMRALTLWQPFAWAVAHGNKGIENRPWAPPAWLIGQRVAIHAACAKHREREARHGWQIYQRTGVIVPPTDKLLRGSIVATARIGAVIDCTNDPARRRALAEQEPWWIGPVGWRLEDVVTFDMGVPCPGNRKLWKLDAHTEDIVRRTEQDMRGTERSRRSVGVIARCGDRYAAIRHVKRGGIEVPGGKVEPGETLEQAAARELFEETGLVPTAPLRCVFRGKVHKHLGYVFVTETAGTPRGSAEGEALWASRADLFDGPLGDVYRAAFSDAGLRGGEGYTPGMELQWDA